MFHFSPLFFTSKMLSFFFWLNDRLSSVEDVQIAVKKSGKESFLFAFYNFKKQTPRVWDMGETRIRYGSLEICRQPLQGLMLYFISSGNLPLDLEYKVCFRGNSAPFWHKRFFSNITWQILSPVELLSLCSWGRSHTLAGLLCLG